MLGGSIGVNNKYSTACILELESEDYGSVNAWHSRYKTPKYLNDHKKICIQIKVSLFQNTVMWRYVEIYLQKNFRKAFLVQVSLLMNKKSAQKMV